MFHVRVCMNACVMCVRVFARASVAEYWSPIIRHVRGCAYVNGLITVILTHITHFPFTVLWVVYYIILCFLRHYFAAHPTTATLFSVVTRVSRRTRRFAQDSTVRTGLDGSRRTRRFAQDSTVRTGLDVSHRTRRFAQDSTVRTRLDGSRRTRRLAQDSTGFTVSSPFWPLRRLILLCASIKLAA